MPAPVPAERRAEVVAEYKRRQAAIAPRRSIAEVARDYHVGSASLKRWLWADANGGVSVPRRRRGRPKKKLTTELADALVAKAIAEPTLTLADLSSWVTQQAGEPVGPGVVRRELHARGIRKRRLERTPNQDRPAEGAVETRYQKRHRRQPEDHPDRRAYRAHRGPRPAHRQPAHRRLPGARLARHHADGGDVLVAGRRDLDADRHLA